LPPALDHAELQEGEAADYRDSVRLGGRRYSVLIPLESTGETARTCTTTRSTTASHSAGRVRGRAPASTCWSTPPGAGGCRSGSTPRPPRDHVDLSRLTLNGREVEIGLLENGSGAGGRGAKAAPRSKGRSSRPRRRPRARRSRGSSSRLGAAGSLGVPSAGARTDRDRALAAGL